MAELDTKAALERPEEIICLCDHTAFQHLNGTCAVCLCKRSYLEVVIRGRTEALAAEIARREAAEGEAQRFKYDVAFWRNWAVFIEPRLDILAEEQHIKPEDVRAARAIVDALASQEDPRG